MITPAVHTLSKVHYGEADKQRAILEACRAARGTYAITPVIFGGKIVAMVQGYWDPSIVHFKPTTQWCGFNSYVDLQNAMNRGQRFSVTFMKADSTSGAGWEDMWCIAADPRAGDYSGAAATARQLNDQTTGAVQQHFTPGGSNTTHLVRLYNRQVGTTARCSICIYDRVLTYDKEVISTTTTTMTNALAAQRYISAGEPGLLIMVTQTTGTGIGATPSNLTTLTYVDDDGNLGQTVPTDTTLNWAVSFGSASSTVSAAPILPFTNSIGYSPFLPLAPGDTGVRSITDYTSSANNTGDVCMALIRPLAWLQIHSTQMTNSVEFSRNLMLLERLYDGACMSVLLRNSAVNFQVNETVEFAWGS